MPPDSSLQPQPEVLAALNQAALAISSDLSLDRTLQHIVNSARTLVGARYAALGIPGEGGALAQFLVSGLTADQQAEIGHLPQALGLLGAILREKRAIRVADIRTDPRTAGFPPGHPPMKSFLGVPVHAGEEVMGNLYLTDKITAPEFSQEDEHVIEILAAHAAIAIKNARLFQASVERGAELEARNRELATLNAVAGAISRYLDLNQVLSEALELVLRVTGADGGEVLLLDEAADELVLALYRGPVPGAFHSCTRFRRGEGLPGRVLASGRPVASTDLPSEQAFLRPEVAREGFHSFVSVPLESKNRVIGTMDLATRARREFSESDLNMLLAIGHQIGMAVENARLYERVGRLAILEERARIGMDLHDGVIQSIYAVGLTLESARMALREDARGADEIVGHAIGALNDAIRDIRNFILDLRPQRFEGDLDRGIARLVREFQANALVPVDLNVSPDAVARLSPRVAQTLFLTTQEALANVARHARASRVWVGVTQEDGMVKLNISDDGRGFDPSGQPQSVGHGLANMRARAADLQGAFVIESRPGRGTALCLSLPL